MRTRGERGKLPRTWMSLSVRSKASWGYFFPPSVSTTNLGSMGGGGGGKTYPRDAEVLNGGDSVACNASKDKKVSISTLINV